MASGDTVVMVIRELTPDDDVAELIVRAGGSTPAERMIGYAFDASTVEYMDFLCQLSGYGGGGLTFTLPWSAANAATGDVQWEMAIRALPDDAEDIDGSHTYAFNSVVDAAPSASGEVAYPTVAFTDGADMDSWADGELAIVRVRRNTAGSDDMANDAQLWGLIGKET